jgi:hypothetical protein
MIRFVRIDPGLPGMKTTVDIADARRALNENCETAAYRLPDRSAGRAGEPNPLEKLSWKERRDEIYGGR